jgi:IS30 family transposase
MWLSHETVYQSLFVHSRGALRQELHSCLRSGRAMRRAKAYTKGNVSQGKIRDMVMISRRPAEIEDRAVPGHWEGDLIFGKKMTAIATLVERHSRFVMLVKLPNGHGAEAVRKAMAKKILTLPAQLRRFITRDQGKEMVEHVQFTIDTGIQIYFCDPKSPWQRGSSFNPPITSAKSFRAFCGQSPGTHSKLPSVWCEPFVCFAPRRGKAHGGRT